MTLNQSISRLKFKCILAAAILVTPAFASGSVLTGDTVTFRIVPKIPTNILVGAGVELTIISFQFDFDAGVDGDLFSWISTPDGGNLGINTSLILSGLDFDDGSSLTGFDLSSTLLSGLTVATTASSITFSYSTGFVGPGDVLVGRYITDASVPEPTTILLMGLGLAGLGLARRRRH